MAEYKSAYTGEEIDAGIDKANTSLQPNDNISNLTNDEGYLTEHQDISGKQNVLISGENIKTINNKSILGSGNLEIDTGGSNVFEGLTASFYGDSLTAVNSQYTKGYHSWIKDLLGLSSYDNYGISGYTTLDCYNKINSTTDTSDIIFVMIGVNDATMEISLGQWGDNTTGTTYGNYYKIMELLKTKYPSKEIIIITPHLQTKYPASKTADQNTETMRNIGEACRQTAKYFAIPCYDNQVLSGFYKTNLNVYTNDNCHWNDKGHELVGKNISKWMLSNIGYVDISGSATLTSITATFNQGSNVIYNDASLNDLKQFLTVTANYNNGSSRTVSDYTLSGTLTVGTSTISVSYGGKTTTFNVTVTQRATLSSISAEYTQGGTVVHTGDSLNSLKANLVVTATYSDSSTAIISDYTLSGTLTVGTSTITVTYEGKTDTFDVVVSQEATLSSISAVYTQSGVVYENTALNDLKADIVVTATYSDSSTAIVPASDYTLSGTLTEGTSVVTVTYEGKTDTINVTVTVAPDWLNKKYTVTSQHGGVSFHTTYVTDTWSEVKAHTLTVNITPISPSSASSWSISSTKNYWCVTSTTLYDGIDNVVDPKNKFYSTDTKTINQDGTITFTITWDTSKIEPTTAPYVRWLFASNFGVGSSFILNSISVVDADGHELTGRNFGGFFNDDAVTVEDV